jgi:Abnormal spindle-like microcephaly-assoc'd, ASPM-SPD-2-Hydin
MQARGMMRRIRRVVRFPKAGWQRLALLCVLVLAGLGSSGVGAIISAPSAQATSNAIQNENTFPGDPTWNDFNANLSQTALSGYASPISVNHGQTVNFYVTTTSATVTIKIYRMGWYGGTGARLMQTMSPFTGQQQAIPNPDPVTGIVVCNWQVSASLAIPSGWTTGVYLAKLVGSSGDKSFIFFNVRNDGGHEDFVFQTSVTTYQAYNQYGGTSLYNNSASDPTYHSPHATKVSFDRPFNPGDGNGSGHFLWYEYPMLRWAEKNGFDMTYTTNIDTDLNTNPLTNHKAFFSVGHDEYWSKAMRDNVEAAIAAGVNAGFFGANDVYWQVRFEPNAAGVPDRVMVGYKDFATSPNAPGPDPQYGVNNAIVTDLWRSPTVNRPENGLIGIMYIDQNKGLEQPYIVTNPSNWIFANTGFSNGTSIPGIVGYEFDQVFNNGATPPGLTVLSSSPVQGNNGTFNANSSIYTAAGGARVFAAGTIEWSWGLDNYGNRTYANVGIQQATANIFYNFNGATPPPPPPPPPPGVYLQDNFESGNTTQWLGPSGTGMASAENTTVHSGIYAAQLVTPSGANQYTVLSKSLVNSPGANTYTRLYFQVSSPNTTASLAVGTDSGGNSMWSAIYDGSSHGVDVYFWNGSHQVFEFDSAANVVQTGWNALEVHMNEVTSGQGQVWLNGNLLGGVSGNLSATNLYTNLQLWNDGAGTTTYFDDVIASNQYNGTVSGGGGPTTFNPTTLVFGNQAVGSASAAQSVTLTNTGTAVLHISSVAITGTNAADFAKTADTCAGAALAVNATCSVSATFSPSATGARSAALAFTDDGVGSPQSVGMSGTGVASAISFSPTSLTYANQGVGSTSAAQTVTVTNTGTSGLHISGVSLTGTNAGDFALSADSCTGAVVAVGATCSVSATFTPGAIGTRTAALAFADDAAGSPQTVAITGTGVAAGPGIRFNPTSLSYASQNIGSTSAAQTITVTNDGTASLHISAVTLTGANPGDFALSANTCNGATVAVNATCTVSVTFSPTATGSRAAALAFADDAPSSPQTVALSGVGVQPGIYLQDGFESGNLSLWSTDGPGSATVQTTTTNSGSYALAMTNAANQYVIISRNLNGGAQAHTFTRLYFRVANASLSATMATATDATGNNLWAVVYDAGNHGLDVYFWNGSRTRFDFYSTANLITANTWYSLEIEINEATTGAGNVWLNGNLLGGVTGNLSATSAVSKLFLWNDVANTTYFDDVIVSSNYNAPLGAGPAVTFTPTSVSFGNQGVGSTSSAQTVTVKNTGTATMHMTTASLTGTNAGDFAISANNCNGAAMAPGATCTVSVTFTPGAAGSRSASLSFTDDAPASPQTVALTGTGTTPQVAFNPTSVNFGNQTVLITSAAQSITVTNTGQASLHVTGITITGTNAGDFAKTADTCTGATVAINATCSVSVTFTPGALGSRTAALSFTDDAPASPQTVNLAGTGAAAAPAVSLNPTSLSYSNQVMGTTSAAKSVTVTNTGTASLHVTMVALAGTNSGDFTVSADTCTGATVAVNATCSVSVTFTPSATGSRTASLTFTDDAGTSPQSAALTGTGIAPAISFNPTSLSYANQGVGTTSAAQSVTVTNNGTAPLHITTATVTGTNAGDYAISANTCNGATVAVNGTCSVSVTFTPTATGTRTAALSFADDAPNSPQTVTLSGSGIQVGVYLQDGFESGNLTQWLAPTGSGTATVQTTVVNRGVYALAMTNGAGQFVTVSQTLLGGAQAHTFTRLYFRINTANVTASVATATDTAGNNLWAVLYDASGHRLDVYFWNSARNRFDFYSKNNVIATNTWYALEIEINEATAGQGNVWLNGTLLGGVTGNLSATNYVNRLNLWNDGASSTIYFDDVIVSNQYNGLLP